MATSLQTRLGGEPRPRLVRVHITTENDPEPEGFGNVAPPTFQNGFLVLEGFWDTYLIRSDLIREIRIVDEENQMPLNYTADEYEAELEKRKSAGEDSKRDSAVALVIDAINAVEKTVDLPDGSDTEAVNKVLASSRFEVIRTGDVDENGNCKHRIRTLKAEAE